MLVSGDVAGTDYPSCISPTLVVDDPYPVVSFPPQSKHGLDANGRRDESIDHVYSRDGITLNRLAMPDVVYTSDDVAFQHDDRRFDEHLSSFCDNENQLQSTTRRSRGHSTPDGVDDVIQRLPTQAEDAAAGAAGAGGLLSDIDKPTHALNDRGSVNTATSVYRRLEHPVSAMYAQRSLSNATSPISSVANCNQSVITNNRRYCPATDADVKRSSSLLHFRLHPDDEDDVTSESKLRDSIAQENCIGEVTKDEADTDVVELERSCDLLVDTTLRTPTLPDHVDKVDGTGDEDGSDNGPDKDTVKNGYDGRQLCRVVDTSECHTFDSSASIYDRIDKYNGVAHRRRRNNCGKELAVNDICVPSCRVSKQQPSNDSILVDSASEKRLAGRDVSAQVDDAALSAKNQAVISHRAETAGTRKSASSFPHSRSNDSDRFVEIEVRTFNMSNGTHPITENRDNGRELDAINGDDVEVTVAGSAAESSLDDCSSKDEDVMARYDSSILKTPSDNGVSLLRCAAVSGEFNGDGVLLCSPSAQNDDKQTQLTDDTTRDRKTRLEHSVSTALSDLDGVLQKHSYNENSRRSADETTQSPVVNIRGDVVLGDPQLSSSVSRNDFSVQSRRPSSAAARGSSLFVVEIDIGEGRPSTSSDERQRRLDAMKKQLLSARPVAPASSNIDSLWSSSVVGKLTPAARARSAVWTPYDDVFSEATTTQKLVADNDRMWRTTSLQTLPGKLASAELSGGAVNVESENKNGVVGECSRQSAMSLDKSRSLSDLRRTEDTERQLQVYEISSVDAELDVEETSWSTVPRRPLPSEEFIRRSLQRLNLPDWYVNSSSLMLRTPVGGAADPQRPSESTPGTVLRSVIDVGQPEEVDRRSLAKDSGHVTSLPSTSHATLSDAATSVSDCKRSKVSKDAASCHDDTSESLHAQPAGDDAATQRAADDVQSSTKYETRQDAWLEHVQSGERRRRRLAMDADELEQRRCRHGKKTSMRCCQCRQEVPDSALSRRRCRTRPSERSTVEATTASVSEVPELPTSDNCNSYDVFGCLSTEQLTVNHDRNRTRETATRLKSSKQPKKRTSTESDSIHYTASSTAADYNIARNHSSYSQEVTVNGGTVDTKGQDIMQPASSPLRAEMHGTRNKSTVRPRSLRLRKVKSRIRSEDAVDDSAGISTSTVEQNVSQQSQLTSEPNYLSENDIGMSFRSRRTPVNRDLTVLASITNAALDIDVPRSGPTHEVPAEISYTHTAAEGNNGKERKCQRRRRRQQQSNCVDHETTNGALIVEDNSCVVDCVAVGRSTEPDCSQVVGLAGLAQPAVLSSSDDHQVGVGGREVRRRRRRPVDKLAATEAPFSELRESSRDDRQMSVLKDRPTSPFSRRPRRLHDDPDCRQDVEPQLNNTEDPSVQTWTPENEHKPCLHGEHSGNVMSRRSLRHSGLECAVKPVFEGSSLTITDDNSDRRLSHCRPDHSSPPTSDSRQTEHQCRRSRCFPEVDSSSYPVDLSTHSRSHAGPATEWTTCRAESSLTEHKPCLSAAARRCRRINKSRRSR